MKHLLFLLLAMGLHYKADASGCDRNDRSPDGTSVQTLETKQMSKFIFRRDDFNFVCTNYQTASLTRTKGPRNSLKAFASDCKNLEAILDLNDGKEASLVRRNIQFQDYDNCGSDIGSPLTSGQIAIQFETGLSWKEEFVFPQLPTDGILPPF